MTMPDAHDEYEYNVLEISPKIPSLQVLTSQHLEYIAFTIWNLGDR